MFEGKYIVRALGDSVLWGQGLLKDKKFAYIVSKYLAALNGAEHYPPYVQAHSGATLAPPPHNTKERRLFADTYRELFVNEAAVELFLGGSDIIAQLLHKEIPVFYPTVLGQIELMTDSAGRYTDLLLL